MTTNELNIMAAALPIVAAVPAMQDGCWPGDGPAHDDDCALSDHAESAAAVAATEGLCWDFTGWTTTADWFRREIATGSVRRHFTEMTDMEAEEAQQAIRDNTARNGRMA